MWKGGLFSMEIKIIPPKDFLQVHQLRDYCFPNKYTGARRDDFHYWVEHSTTLGAYDEHKVVGQLLILPLNMTINDKRIQKMALTQKCFAHSLAFSSVPLS